ncbi:MAG: serine/threonine-protein kinase [Solirubrobacteraceae bacterium]|nr:serine/threonine-protein kinase [Solirubrobacteraceae bacterium]
MTPDGAAAVPGGELLGGRYRLEQILGSGGMAIVWRATDLRLGRTVAIKLIADTLAADPAYLERFTREARTAAGLSHPNLVGVYDYAASAERPFLVMELVEGGTLADRIVRGAVDAEEVRAVARDLLSALACVHRAGILHRDIKPANVLLGSDGRARLTDFGIAHPEDATRLTQTGHLVGTIRYLAPELVEGAPPTVRSDLFALGVLLRELAGEGLAGHLRRLVERLADPDPARRPGSASEALAAIAPAVNEPARAAPDDAGPAPTETREQLPAPAPAARPARRDVRATAVPVIVTAIVLLLVVAFVLALDGDDDGGAADAPTAAGQPPLTLEGRLDQLDRIIRGEAP